MIASDFGPYPSSIIHGETGFLVRRPHEWAKYLNALLFDDELRERMSASAKAWAASRTIQGNVWRWENVFHETIEHVHGPVARVADDQVRRAQIEVVPSTPTYPPASEATEKVEPMRIEAWAAADNGPAQYRIALPGWGLALRGHEVRAFAGKQPAIAADADVLVAQLVVEESRLDHLRNYVKRPDRRAAVIVEIDDDYWNIHESNATVYWMRSPEPLARIEESLRLADAVTVTTEALATVARQFNPHVYVLPNCIDLNLLLHERPEPGRLTVGWAGSNSHSLDFASMQGALSQFPARHPELDWHFIGTDCRGALGITAGRYSLGNPDLTTYLEMIDFHIGIAPLASDTFNLSKSDIRILEYSALGIPVIASNFGEYAKAITHGETGLLVDSPEQWATHLEMLVEDEKARRLMGINAKIWASERTIQGNAWRWEKAYRETLSRVRGEDYAADLISS